VPTFLPDEKSDIIDVNVLPGLVLDRALIIEINHRRFRRRGHNVVVRWHYEKAGLFRQGSLAYYSERCPSFTCLSMRSLKDLGVVEGFNIMMKSEFTSHHLL